MIRSTGSIETALLLCLSSQLFLFPPATRLAMTTELACMAVCRYMSSTYVCMYTGTRWTDDSPP